MSDVIGLGTNGVPPALWATGGFEVSNPKKQFHVKYEIQSMQQKQKINSYGGKCLQSLSAAPEPPKERMQQRKTYTINAHQLVESHNQSTMGVVAKKTPSAAPRNSQWDHTTATVAGRSTA